MVKAENLGMMTTFGQIIPEPKTTAILCPSLRPEKHPEIIKNLDETTKDYEIYFLGEEYPSYATAINAGYKLTKEPYIFLGADDLVFSEGWLEAALKKMTGKIQVVGTNDGGNSHGGDYSTHTLIKRSYIDKQGGDFDSIPGKVLHEYQHLYPDTELLDVAKQRGVYAYAPDALVAHVHWTKGADFDEVYRKGNARANGDKQTYEQRKKEWKKSL